MTEYDPITLKILWDRLVAICEDAGATMVRTTFSPIVREGNDYSCSLIDTSGLQVAEPPFTLPSFTGTLPFTVRHMLDRYPLEHLKEGDSIVTNDSWMGTGHLNDFNIGTPVFDKRGSVVAIASSTAHMTDVGGSINFGATRDVHEEGIRIPVMKIVRAGVLNDELIDLLLYNVRVPELVRGDLTGMLAANQTMSTRLLALLDETGIDDLDTVFTSVQDLAEQAMREAIAEIPEGVYEAGVTFDGPGFPVTIQVKITIANGEIEVDYSGSSLQHDTTSINVVFNYTYSFTVYILKLLIHPRLPNNDGCLRPFKIHAPEGSIMNARYPAAGFSRNFVGHMIHAAIFSALENVLPQRIWGHSGSAPAGLESLSGLKDNGEPFVNLFFAFGGSGACPTKDGEVCCFPSNGAGIAVESTEQLAPVLFERKAILQDTAGPGKYRGGIGTDFVIRNIGERPILYSGQVGRLNYPAKGLLGGGDGSLNVLYLNDQLETRGWGRYELAPGDTFRKVNPGGGGLYSPLSRSPESVLEDVLEGFVSEAAAESIYGVKIREGQIKRLLPSRQDS